MIKKMFLNQKENRLRAGWRISIFIFFYLALSRILNELSFKIIGRLDRTTWSWWIVRGFLVIIASTCVVWIIRKYIDKKSFRSLGLLLNGSTAKDFFVGLGISGLMIGMLFVVFLISGLLKVKEIGWSSSGFSAVFGILFWFFGIGLAVGWSEELAFRGYLLQNMKDGMGIGWAVLLSCVLYGLLHMSNPNSSILSGVLIAIFGYVRIFAWLRTGQLWLSMGMHAGWNFFQGSVLGFTVSGMKTESLIRHTISGAGWITGGSFGPEAGILVIPFVILGLIMMYVWTAKRENTPWNEKRRGEMKPKFMISSIGIFTFLIIFLHTNAQSDDTGSTGRLVQEISRLEKIAGGSIGVGSIHLETERSFYYNGEVRYPMASTYKVPIAVQLLSRVEKGEIQLADKINVEKTDLHPGSGTITQMLREPGVSLSLHNLLELMLLVSDNSAADLCIQSAGGTAAVTQKMREMGIDDIDISRSTFVSMAHSLGITIFKEGDVYDEIEAYGALSKLTEPMREQAWQTFLNDPRDTATPVDMTKLLQKIWNRKALNNENSRLLLGIMKRCQTGENRIRGALPPETTVYSKTGTIHRVVNDVGIVKLPADAGNIVTVIFIKDIKIEIEECEKIIAHIARSLYDYFLFSSN